MKTDVVCCPEDLKLRVRGQCGDREKERGLRRKEGDKRRELERGYAAMSLVNSSVAKMTLALA